MADREKAIKGLECCLSGGNADACEECPYKVPCHATVGKGTISPLLEDTIELLKEQNGAKDINVLNNGWISVKTRLPENNVRVLVYSQTTNGMFVDKITDKRWWVLPEPYEVTHWMPLPPGPKEDV